MNHPQWLAISTMVFLVLAIQAPRLSAKESVESREITTDTKQVGFFQKHPKARKFSKIAALGAVTGGLGGLVLGGGIVGHAIAGAGIHTGIAAVRDRKRPPTNLMPNNQDRNCINWH